MPARVLVADDEHAVALSLAESLRDMGVQIVGPAGNGHEAVDLARRQGADLALIDIHMPQMDGLEVAEILYHRMGIPVVIISAYSDPEYVQRSAKVGVFGYLLKPVTANELRTSLAVAWSRFRDQARLRSEVEELKTAMEQRKVVERAKGILMDRLGLRESEAMQRLQKQARDTRRKLHEVAQSILDSEHLFGQQPPRRPE